MEIPVYLVTGFLDSGKTTFINGIFEDGFAREDKTLLLCCEEGETEYEEAAMDNVTVVQVEEEEQLTEAFLRECEKKYRPAQILIEYNGMWPLEKVCTKVLPKNWILYQILTFVDAPTFELYAKNMGQLMMEKVMNADMLVFNRCTEELRDSLRQRNLRMVNRQGDIFLEYPDGSNEPYSTDECPFDLEQPVIDIPDDDFGLWYVDVMDNPQRYEGKTVHMKLVMAHSSRYPGAHCPGRFAMVCCENDIQFLGLLAKGENLERYRNRDWVEVTADMSVEEHPAYQGIGPVMNITAISACEKPKNDVVSF
ncbi:MAG: GTP-binding protein [Candidatus Heteroscillospira sp.]|jgi:putative membrane protein